jgi:1,4-dihydroxy-2-naphthoyl-CoA hydrolase
VIRSGPSKPADSGAVVSTEISAGEATERILARSTFDVHIGTEVLDLGPDEARARIAVGDHHQQPLGLVHGGVFTTLAETICSVATAAVAGDGMTIVGQSNNTSFLRPITEGHLNAVARPRHCGRTTWIWEVEISNDEQRVCALARVTIAVRPARGEGRGGRG